LVPSSVKKKKYSHKGPELGSSDLSNQKCELDQKTNASFLLDTAVVKTTDVLKFEVITCEKKQPVNFASKDIILSRLHLETLSFKRQFFIEHGAVSAKTATVIRDKFSKEQKRLFSGTGRKITYDLWGDVHRKINCLGTILHYFAKGKFEGRILSTRELNSDMKRGTIINRNHKYIKIV